MAAGAGEEEGIGAAAQDGTSTGGSFGAGAGGGAANGKGDGWVQLLSVTSDNPQFHPASFQPHALPPEGRTSFQARSVVG